MIYLKALFFAFVAFLLVKLLSEIAPKSRAKVLDSVPKNKAKLCLIDKVYVCITALFSITGHVFNVHKPIIYVKQGIFKQKYT